MLDWSRQFSILLFLDNNEYPGAFNRYECLLAVDAVSVISGDGRDLLKELSLWHAAHRDWLFGHISYDYKDLLESRLSSDHEIRTGFPPLYFFCPRIVCYISNDRTTLTIECIDADPEDIFNRINGTAAGSRGDLPSLSFNRRIDKPAYLSAIRALRQHIADGDCYEINFCNEGYCEGVSVDPLQVFGKLNELSPAPFAACYRLGDRYMMCASPERYLFREGRKIISQPIKGTAKRAQDAQEDDMLREGLRQSIKERAENVMIVDLVRNDLARSCETGSVHVDELFGIYSFPQVHQMVSTVSAQLRSGVPFSDAIRYSFPMGSMTGAPKAKVMQLIERYEHSRRELFSGTVGYIAPDGDFDFNVIIRSLFYNAATRYLSYQTGGAITYDSDPLLEWEEMRLKAWALERIFS